MEKILTGAYFKIYLNYSQIISIISTLNLTWNEKLTKFFQAYTLTSGNLQQMIALDCMIESMTIFIYEYIINILGELSYYFRMVVLVFYPFLFSVFLMAFWLIYKFYHKVGFFYVLERFFITSGMIMVFFISPIINILSDFLNCTQIYENYYITNFLIEKCNDNSKYTFVRNVFVIPSLFFFAFIFPFFFFVYMFKNRQNLYNYKIMAKVSFWMNGYSIKTFYWLFK